MTVSDVTQEPADSVSRLTRGQAKGGLVNAVIRLRQAEEAVLDAARAADEAGLTIDDICRETGWSRATAYRRVSRGHRLAIRRQMGSVR